MTPRIMIDSDGNAFASFDPDDGVSLETDMHWTDNLPAHVIPCPDAPEWQVAAWGCVS